MRFNQLQPTKKNTTKNNNRDVKDLTNQRKWEVLIEEEPNQGDLFSSKKQRDQPP